jgi:transcriptional regulator of acetoin/glycerol metabolism
LSKAAEDAIAAFRWPGNVRQLQNEMQRIAALCEGPEVQVADLSAEARG